MPSAAAHGYDSLMTTSNRTQIRSLIAAGALLLASQYSRAASYYVAVNGNNANPGTT